MNFLLSRIYPRDREQSAAPISVAEGVGVDVVMGRVQSSVIT